MPAISRDRRIERREYAADRRTYLEAHPLCQVTLALNRIPEEAAVNFFHLEGRTTGVRFPGCDTCPGPVWIPRATQIHHRNKANGRRLLDMLYWMSASPAGHRWVEENKGKAREIGLLCPINAQPDGTMPDGRRCATTAELLRDRAQGLDCQIYPS